MAGEIIVAATFAQVRQPMRRAWAFTGMVRGPPCDRAHSMSQSTPRSERPVIRSYITFSTPPRTGWNLPSWSIFICFGFLVFGSVKAGHHLPVPGTSPS